VAPLQIPLNFKFKPLFLISSPLYDEGSSSSAQPTIVSSANISPSQVASNLACEDLSNHIPPKKQELYKNSRKFQDAWTTHLPWVESIIDEKGLVQQVRCTIYTVIRGKEKLLAPKPNSLLKHVGHWKTKFLMPSVNVSSHYFNKIWCMLRMDMNILLLSNLYLGLAPY
jgi:hypothetical protein